ncbi:hypothetical protein JCM19000A_00430 [Silvimonas sp. JCM 19000]
MKQIKNYVAPSPADLQALKEKLGFTGEQMAEMAGLAGNNQWRKYTGGNSPREMSQHMLFYMAALSVLPDQQLEDVLQAMRSIGATFDGT